MARWFVIRSSDIARCPTHNISPSHWRADRTCMHEDPAEPADDEWEGEAPDAHLDAEYEARTDIGDQDVTWDE